MTRYLGSLSLFFITFVTGLGFVLANDYLASRFALIGIPDLPESADTVSCPEKNTYQVRVDELAIYLQILKDEKFGESPLIVDQTLANEQGWSEGVNAIPGASLDTIADYESKNRVAVSLREIFDEKEKVQFITRTEVDRTFRVGSDGWRIFARNHPKANGFVSFSRIGFNQDRSEAIVYFGHGCGWLCGHGELSFYEKAPDGSWYRAGGGIGWVS